MDNKKELFFDRIIERVIRSREQKHSFSLMEATGEQIDYAIERLRKDGYDVIINDDDLIVTTRSRKTPNNLRFADDFDITRESINLIIKSDIRIGDTCTNGQKIVKINDLYYNSEDDEFYYGYTDRMACSRIMKYDEFVKTFRRLEKRIHD